MGRKRGLYDNINARKRAGTSRSKKNTTISPEAYKDMQSDFGRKRKEAGGEMKKRTQKKGGGMGMGTAMVDTMSPRKRMGMNKGGYGRQKMRHGGLPKGNGKSVRGPCS